MRQRELVALMKLLEELTRSQRQWVVAELTTGERKAASIELIEASAGDSPAARTARAGMWSRMVRRTACSATSASLAAGASMP